jgi:hypothetical protein
VLSGIDGTKGSFPASIVNLSGREAVLLPKMLWKSNLLSDLVWLEIGLNVTLDFQCIGRLWKKWLMIVPVSELRGQNVRLA